MKFDHALFGFRLKRAAKEVGFTTLRLACCFEVQIDTISRWWQGTRQPRYEDLCLYAELVERPVGWFFEGVYS